MVTAKSARCWSGGAAEQAAGGLVLRGRAQRITSLKMAVCVVCASRWSKSSNPPESRPRIARSRPPSPFDTKHKLIDYGQTARQVSRMSVVHVRQIKGKLQEIFTTSIDMSDLKSTDTEKEKKFLTRALAAYALSIVAELAPAEAAARVTDGFGDNGIDAIYYAEDLNTLFLVQSKWADDGNKTIELSGTLKFAQGIGDLINDEREKFNEKINKLWPSFEAALNQPAKIQLILAHTGSSQLSVEVMAPLNKLCSELNDPVAIASVVVIDQSRIYSALTSGIDTAPIDVDVMLRDWGQVREPYRAVYGQLAGSDIVRWYTTFGDRLFAKNLRKLLGQSDVNEQISLSAEEAPESFWYLNNGITALADSLEKNLMGGKDTTTGVFACKNVSIVNGAQTVGSLSRAAQKKAESIDKVRVHIRIISLSGCPPEFAAHVTRATNTQNRIEPKDFAALDSNQERIRTEMLLLGKTYAYKSGDPQISHDQGVAIEEATVALACVHRDVANCVRAKNHVSSLWSDIKGRPYTDLFNKNVTAVSLWRTVDAFRIIQQQCSEYAQKSTDRRDRLIVTNGALFIAHLVLQQARTELASEAPLENIGLDVKVKRAAAEVCGAVKRLMPNAYPMCIFKNQARCKEIKDDLITRGRLVGLSAK
ncbi:AIPR family protein [Nannocystis pusilla]|uniref:AIPR family protein n=1 Tax=Nannocystis pusilla TaxID=889268 RepID=UPI003DA28D08